MKQKGRPKLKSDLLFTTLTNNIENICIECGNNKTYIKIRNGRGSPVWYNYKGGKICQNCYSRIVLAPKHNKKNNEKLKWYRLDYMGINLLLSFELPRNRCEVCGILKGQGQKIHRHHYFYCVIMPWACTISICNSCHTKITHEGKVRVKSTIRTCLICHITDNYKKIPYKYESGYICDNCDSKNRYYIKINKKLQIKTHKNF